MKKFEKYIKIYKISEDKIYLLSSSKSHYYFKYNKGAKYWGLCYPCPTTYCFTEYDVLSDINLYLTHDIRPHFKSENVYELDTFDEISAILSLEELIG